MKRNENELAFQNCESYSCCKQDLVDTNHHTNYILQVVIIQACQGDINQPASTSHDAHRGELPKELQGVTLDAPRIHGDSVELRRPHTG